MPAFLTKPANVLTITLTLIVVGILTYLGTVTMGRPKAAALGTTHATAPTTSELRQALSLAGLSPHTLAAAGLQEAQVGGVVANARAYLTDHNSEFQAALASSRQTAPQVENLERRARSGLASQEDLNLLPSSRTALANADAGKETALAGLIAAATAGLPAQASQTLAALRTNRGQDLPVQYKVVSRTDAQWLTLRNALANQRISARLGEGSDETCRQAVLDANADSAVSNAASGLNSLATLTSAWNNAVEQ